MNKKELYECTIAALKAAKRHLEDSTHHAHDYDTAREDRLFDTDESAQRAYQEICDLLVMIECNTEEQ